MGHRARAARGGRREGSVHGSRDEDGLLRFAWWLKGKTGSEWSENQQRNALHGRLLVLRKQSMRRCCMVFSPPALVVGVEVKTLMPPSAVFDSRSSQPSPSSPSPAEQMPFGSPHT